MIIAIVPITILLIIVLAKKIPKIGGNIYLALFVAGFIALMMGQVFNPLDWLKAFVNGLDRLAWVMALSLIGSIYSEAQMELGTVNTIMSSLKARFKDSPKGLVLGVLFVLVLSGTFLGDAIATSTVVGVLTIGTMAAIGLAPEAIAAIIVMGACLGSIMPPITQAIFLSTSLVGTDLDPVMNIGYPTVAICVVLCSLYVYFFMLRKVKKISVETDKTASEILRANLHTLIPFFVLVIIVLLRTINWEYKFDLMPWLISQIPAGEKNLYQVMQQTIIVKGLTNGIVLCLVFALGVCFLFPKVYRNAGSVFKNGFRKVKYTLLIQAGCSFMVGAFYNAGQIEAVQTFAKGLNSNALIWGGIAAMMVIGMLTGSQSTTQNVIFTFFGPALVAIGMNPTVVAAAGAHLAMCGQGIPPADLTTFVVCGIVGGTLNVKCDPLKSMFYSLFMCICFMAVGVVLLYGFA